MPKLTKRVVEALTPRGTDFIAFDDEVKGFGIRVFPNGKLTYLAQYRASGRTRRVKIGRHGVLTADEARTKAKEILGAVAKGDNPAGAISDHRRAPTIATVCDRFLREHVWERCKPTTQREYTRAIDLFIKPAIGAFKVVDVARGDVSALHHKLRATPYQANRVLGVLSKMFNLTEVWGLRADGSNPCRHVPKYREQKRETFLSGVELSRLADVLTRAEDEGTETAHVVAAFRLLILTGCRLSEIQTLKWRYVSGGYLLLPDSKTGARRIPLAPEAIEILQNLPRVADNEYVIAGKVRGKHCTDLQHPWRRIRESAGLPTVRIHDLRHTYASMALLSGQPIVMVGKLLGHTQLQTTMRYAHIADQPVRDAASSVADLIGKSFKVAPAKETRVPGMNNVLKFPSVEKSMADITS